MKEEDIHSELSAIRNLMERSAKFVSLSGLSGIMAGLYALAGGWLAYRFNGGQNSGQDWSLQVTDPVIRGKLALTGLAVLLLSLATAVWLSVRKARKQEAHLWNAGSKRLLASLATPLVTGGLFMLLLMLRGEYELLAAASLLFYGISLVAGSQYTFSDVKWLGFSEILLGLLAVLAPGCGLLFWIAGFGLLHILYGIIMHFKYDR